MNEHDFMIMALEEAKKAYELGEVPVGSVIVKNGEVLAAAHNYSRTTNNPTRHAEMVAIETAARILGNERLTECDMYVTKEPCAMCAGAIVHARIKKVVIGTRDIRFGACGTVLSVCGNTALNHLPEIKFGICEDEASALLKNFFRERR